MERSEIASKYAKELRNAAERLFHAAYMKAAMNPSFFSLVVFKVQQTAWQKAKSETGAYDYDFWKAKGWLDTGCQYYFPLEGNRFKTWLARLAGSLVAMFFL